MKKKLSPVDLELINSESLDIGKLRVIYGVETEPINTRFKSCRINIDVTISNRIIFYSNILTIQILLLQLLILCSI